MRSLNSLLLSIYAANAVAEVVNGVNFVNEHTDTATIRRGLFGNPKSVAAEDDGWESKTLIADDESKSIVDKVVEDMPQVQGALIQFAYDSAQIESVSYPILGKFGQVLQDAPMGVQVEITGHTDCLGRQGYNANLAWKRAQAVKEFLVGTYQLTPDLLQVNAKGEVTPLQGVAAAADTNAACRVAQSENERAWNRRVEFMAIK